MNWVDITILFGVLSLIPLFHGNRFHLITTFSLIGMLLQIIIRGPILATVGNFISEMEKIVKTEKRQNCARPDQNYTETV